VPGPAGQLLVDGARSAFISGADRAVPVAVVAAVPGSLAAVLFLPALAVTEPEAVVVAGDGFAGVAELSVV
jgi:hypothetical protein